MPRYLTIAIAIATMFFAAAQQASADDFPSFQDRGNFQNASSRELRNCKDRLTAGRFRNRMAYARCTNAVNEKYWRKSGQNYPDLLQSGLSQEIALAERFDRGGMTDAQYWAFRAKFVAEVNNAIRQRDAWSAAQNQTATSVYTPRAPINCFTTGRMTSCF